MASIKRRPERGNKWQATYRGPDGRERAKLFDRRVDAERWVAQAQTDLARGTYVDPKAGRVSVRDYAADWVTRQPQWSESTRSKVDNAMGHLLPVLGNRPVSAVSKRDVQAFVTSLDGLAPNTVATVHQHVRSLFSAVVEDGIIARNPAVGVKLPKVDRPLVVPMSVDEVRRLETEMAHDLRAAIVVGAGLGLRQGECCGLTVDRVDWLRRQVRVDRQMLTPASGPPSFAPPKSGSYRTIPASDVVLEALTEHVRHVGAGPVGLLFHREGKPIPRNNFTRLVKRAVERAGLVDVTYHDLRHHFASTLIAAGCSIKAVQEALGHQSATITLDTYSHLFPADHDRIRSAVENSLRPSDETNADQTRTSGAD